MRLGAFWCVLGRVASVMVRFGVRGSRLSGVFGAPRGCLERVWGVVPAAPKRQKPCVLRRFLAFSRFGPCAHANGCSSGACGQHGTSGKQLVKDFGAPRGDSSAPETSWGRFGPVMAAFWGVVGRFSLPKKCPKAYVLRCVWAFSCFGHLCHKKRPVEGAWGRSGASGKPLEGLLGAPVSVLGASWGVLGRLGRLLVANMAPN